MQLSQIVLQLQNLILGYIYARDLKIYVCMISCMSRRDDNLDRILGGSMSDKLVVMTKSSPQLTTWLLTELAGGHTGSHK